MKKFGVLACALLLSTTLIGAFTTQAHAQQKTQAIGQTCTYWCQVIVKDFGPYGQENKALSIAKCESGINPNAVNKYSGAMGMFQFLPSTWRGTPYASDNPYNGETNTLAAVWLWKHYGWGQWVCQ